MSDLQHAIEQRWNASDGTQLAGTLQLPRPARDVPGPGVLLISGSGPIDRNSNMDGQRVDIAKALAEHLATLGVASLRFDKRGTGRSGGDYPTTGFDTEHDDITSALEHLSTVDHVDPQRIGLIGHSVGATMAIRLAASEPAIAAIVLLAGASSPGQRVLDWQSDRIGQTLPGPNWLTGRLFRAVQRRSHAKLTDPKTDSITASGVPMSGRWFREYAAYDPTDDLRRITCPVFAITGGKDLQVNPAELAVIASLVTGPCRTESPADLTHVLRSTTRPPRISQYHKLLDQPVDPSLLASIGDWLTTVLEPR